MPRGGARPGAGRPKGYGRFNGEPTEPIRAPVQFVKAWYDEGMWKCCQKIVAAFRRGDFDEVETTETEQGK